jgi:hypothetical protein
MQSEQVAERVDRQKQLRAALAFGIVVASRVPLSGVERSVRLSKIAAEGSSSRPAASRGTARGSCAMASRHPAAIQRCAC